MPIDASIPLSYAFPKFMTPADAVSLRDLATQTKLRQAELEDLPAKRQYERETRLLDQQIKQGQLDQTKFAQDWARQEKRKMLRDSVNQIGFNTIQVGRSRGLADSILTNSMRQSMVDELERQKQSGKLAMLGIDDATYQQLRSGIMGMTPDQIEAAVMSPAQALEQAQYPAAPMQQGVPLSGIPDIQSPQSSVPVPQEPGVNVQPGMQDVLTDRGAHALLDYDMDPNNFARADQFNKGEPLTKGGMPLSDIGQMGVTQPVPVPRETAAAQQTPWDQFDAQADALEARGGKVNYERAQNLRKRAEEMRDNDRDERRLAAQKEAKFGASEIKMSVAGREAAFETATESLTKSKNAYEGLLVKDRNVENIRRAIESGNVNLGTFAKGRQAWDRFMSTIGLGGKDTEERLANTQQVITSLAKQIIAARGSLKGQGNISEGEQKMLANAESGDINELSPAELQALLQLHDRTMRQLYIEYQREYKAYSNHPSAEFQQMAPILKTREYQKQAWIGGKKVTIHPVLDDEQYKKLPKGAYFFEDDGMIYQKEE